MLKQWDLLQQLQQRTSVSSLQDDELRSIFEAIFQSGYFTNHGPLAQEFESQLQQHLDIENVVSIGNESLALLIALMNCVRGKTILAPKFGGNLIANIATWLNLEVIFCDVDFQTGQPTFNDIEFAISSEIKTIVLVETWGHRLCQDLIRKLTQQGFNILIVAFDSFGSVVDDRLVNQHPNVITVFSFETGKLIDTLEGGAIATSDADLAERFRNTRSSYGMRKNVGVKVTCNGRFSEFQAGSGIVKLKKLENAIQHHYQIAEAYQAAFHRVSSISSMPKQLDGIPNHQCFPILLNEDDIGNSDSISPVSIATCFPNSYKLFRRAICLPISTTLSIADATKSAAEFASKFEMEPNAWK